MRRFLVFVGVCLILCGVGIKNDVKLSLKDIAGEGEYCFYSDSKDSIFEGERISMGRGEILICSAAEAKRAGLHIDGLLGESLTFSGGKADIEAIEKRYRIAIVRRESVEGIEVIYGFSSYLGAGVNVFGKTVNVQLALRGGKITVGTPLILGSY